MVVWLNDFHSIIRLHSYSSDETLSLLSLLLSSFGRGAGGEEIVVRYLKLRILIMVIYKQRQLISRKLIINKSENFFFLRGGKEKGGVMERGRGWGFKVNRILLIIFNNSSSKKKNHNKLVI